MSPHVKADIPSYVNGDLAESRSREVEAHLAECDRCRAVANRAKAKNARLKRQALKKASSERVPNLLLTRLSREAGYDRTPKRGPWLGIGIFFLVLVCLVWWVRQRYWHVPGGATGGLTASSATVAGAGFDVDHSSAGVTPQGAALIARSSTTTASSEVQEWTAADSQAREFRHVVIRARGGWRALWNELGKPSPAPRVDFNTMLVVGVLAGDRVAGGEVTLGRPRETEDEVIIPYRVGGATTTADGGTLVRPYILRTLPRSGKRVRFESLS
jgi:anti-sigma factor RsiW